MVSRSGADRLECGLVWSRHVGDPILASNITRRVDFALFMVEALSDDELIHEARAIVSCHSPAALAQAAASEPALDGSDHALPAPRR